VFVSTSLFAEEGLRLGRQGAAVAAPRVDCAPVRCPIGIEAAGFGKTFSAFLPGGFRVVLSRSIFETPAPLASTLSIARPRARKDHRHGR
jgi:hypothetical protein